MKPIYANLSTNEALVLQQVYEDGEENARTLARQLNLSRPHVVTILSRLRQKGLISLDSDMDGLWTRVTKNGSQLIRSMWPDAKGTFA